MWRRRKKDHNPNAAKNEICRKYGSYSWNEFLEIDNLQREFFLKQRAMEKERK